MTIVQAIKKLNSISRERSNFRRRPILCTTLYRNPIQARNGFGGTFDQLFLWIFYAFFTQDATLLFLYHGAKKSKMTKNSNQGERATPDEKWQRLMLERKLRWERWRKSRLKIRFRRGGRTVESFSVTWVTWCVLTPSCVTSSDRRSRPRAVARAQQRH